MAQAARLLPDGSVRLTADLGTYEVINDPDADAPDSNPYGILVLPGRRIVADAGANALLEVRANGDIRTLAVFPESQLPGDGTLCQPASRLAQMAACTTFDNSRARHSPSASAKVYRIAPEGGEPEMYADGFTNIIDIEFGRTGAFMSSRLPILFRTSAVESCYESHRMGRERSSVCRSSRLAELRSPKTGPSTSRTGAPRPAVARFCVSARRTIARTRMGQTFRHRRPLAHPRPAIARDQRNAYGDDREVRPPDTPPLALERDATDWSIERV